MITLSTSSGKKFLCLLLFLSFSVDPLVGTFTWLHHKKAILRKEVRRHIEAGIDKGRLITLKFSREEAQIKLRWHGSREFEHDDHMYDVVAMVTLGDTVYYLCWRDDEETALNREMEELAAKALGKNARNLSSLAPEILWLKSLKATFSAPSKVPAPGWLGKPVCILSCFYASIPIPPPTPPPRLS